MPKPFVNITCQGLSASDRERTHRRPVTLSSNKGITKPLPTPPACRIRALDSPFISIRRNSLLGTVGVDTGHWSWDQDKPEVVFCRKIGDLHCKQGSLTTKSPAKAIITTKSPAMASVRLKPSDSLRNLPHIRLNSPRQPYSPLPISAFEPPGLFVESDCRSTFPLPPSSPPPLSGFAEWLLPDGIDTSIPDDDSDLSDLMSSSFALTNTSNADSDLSTISSDSSSILTTPGRGIGLGLCLGHTNSQLSVQSRVFCHDGEISETFLKEASFTFDAMRSRIVSCTPFTAHRGRREDIASSHTDVFNPSITSRFDRHIGNIDSDFTPKLASHNVPKSDMDKSFSSTPQNESLMHIPPDAPPASPVSRNHNNHHSKATVPAPNRSIRNRLRGNRSCNKAMITPATGIRLPMNLQRRSGRDVTLATISSALKIPSALTVATVNCRPTSVISRALSRTDSDRLEAVEDLRKVVAKEVVRPGAASFISKVQAEDHRGSGASSNMSNSKSRMSWR
ncbi:hypothetical protein F5050DRAFT_1808542 [Lentinula boryana]|uniref:Uncharacterized protein n=1 Tax=Lentinula boryana TaxID=40481 RepID=A0ABQ8QAV6_9AGAR|nr:hypothetical protein F5050DRAFT_1808542 [Lentinula boryana]